MEYRGILSPASAKRPISGSIFCSAWSSWRSFAGVKRLFRLLAVHLLSSTFWIAINLAAAALAAAYFWLNRPGRCGLRWLDEQLNSKERLQTCLSWDARRRGRPAW